MQELGSVGDDTLDVRAASAGVTVNFADGTVDGGFNARSSTWSGHSAVTARPADRRRRRPEPVCARRQ